MKWQNNIYYDMKTLKYNLSDKTPKREEIENKLS
jgi:hypothetical protein